MSLLEIVVKSMKTMPLKGSVSVLEMVKKTRKTNAIEGDYGQWCEEGGIREGCRMVPLISGQSFRK